MRRYRLGSTMLAIFACAWLTFTTPIRANEVDYSAQVPLPPEINKDLQVLPYDEALTRLGVPGSPTVTCSEVKNLTLASKIVTENVGPFSVTGIKPAVSTLKTIFLEIKASKPDVYSKLESAGMLCVRKVSNSSKFSNHSWGMAIDLKIDGVLSPLGKATACKGLVEIHQIFQKHGFYWGAGFSTVTDPMHFEVSKNLFDTWKASGDI